MGHPAQFTPVTGNNLSEKVAARIEAAILGGTILPGNRLSSERELQNQFEVGRGAVREALKTLKQKGIIEIRKGVKGGVYVKKMEIDNASESLSLLLKQNKVPIADLVEFRDAVDETEVLLASIRGDKKEKDQLVEMAMQLAELNTLPAGPDIEQIKAIDREMNLLLAKMTKNFVFVWMKNTIQLSIGSYDSLLYESSKYRAQTIDNWINTAREIAAGEPLRALSLCSYHYVLLQNCLKDKQLEETGADDHQGRSRHA